MQTQHHFPETDSLPCMTHKVVAGTVIGGRFAPYLVSLDTGETWLAGKCSTSKRPPPPPRIDPFIVEHKS